MRHPPSEVVGIIVLQGYRRVIAPQSLRKNNEVVKYSGLIFIPKNLLNPMNPSSDNRIMKG